MGEILFVEVGPRDELLLACSVNEAVRAPPRQHQRRLKEKVLWSPSYLCGRYIMEYINQPYKTHLFCGNATEIFLRSWYNKVLHLLERRYHASFYRHDNYHYSFYIYIYNIYIYIIYIYIFALAARKHTYSYTHIQLTCLCGHFTSSVALLFFPSFFPSPLFFCLFFLCSFCRI